MDVRSHVRLYDTSGSLVALFDNWYSLIVEHRVNHPSTHTFTIPGNDNRVDLFQLDGFLEVIRQSSHEDIDPYVEYGGFHRTKHPHTEENGRDLFTSYGRSPLDLIGRRTLRYFSDTAYTNKSGPADDVMKAFVRENAGSLATDPPRITAGTITGLSVQADTGDGPTWEGSVAWRNLLDVLQDIALASGVDFDVVKTGASTFEFRTYYPQLGTDRSSSVIFSTHLGNMISPSYSLSRVEEANDVLVLGQGQESDRLVVQRTTTATADSPWNRIESLYNSNQDDEVAALEDSGDARLEELQAKETFTFDVLQIPILMYGKDYFLGDIVTGRYKAIERQKKIVAVTLNIGPTGESVSVELSDHA